MTDWLKGRWNGPNGQPYGTRKCPTCNGRKVNPVLPTLVCPKCHGEGRIAEKKH